MSGNNASKAKEGNKEQVTCLVVGAGSRGKGYATYAELFPDEMKVVGVAEPSEARRNKLLKYGTISDDKVFSDWKEAAKREKFADFVIIATTDRHHKDPAVAFAKLGYHILLEKPMADPAVAFAKLGYHILLEKPMAVTEEDCREIVEVCESCNVKLAVCHVLRYTPWVTKIKEIIESGKIGEVVSIRHTEPIGFWHYAHSYVRGNWRNEAISSFCLLAKSCHDVDLINYWMSPRKCVNVSSFGKLTHFTKKDKPPTATARCLDCPVENKCPYSAKRFYLDNVKMGNTGWPVSVLTDVVDIENVTEALRSGPYGKCVYDTDNDVVSHQVVNFQFDDGATACFNMVAFSKRVCAREVKIYGTMGEIAYEDGWGGVEVFDFLTDQTFTHNISSSYPQRMGGHGGADFHLMKSFIDTLRSKSEKVVTGPQETLNSHLLVFAAEKARLENRVVTINPDGTF